MKPGGPYEYITIKLSPEGARQALRSLADVLDLLQQPSSIVSWPGFGPRVSGPLRLVALLLERSLDETDQLAPRWPSSLGSIFKIQPRKIP